MISEQRQEDLSPEWLQSTVLGSPPLSLPPTLADLCPGTDRGRWVKVGVGSVG